MAFTRIQFASDSGFTVGSYYVPINPTELDLHWDDKQNVIETLDGHSVVQYSYVDTRPYRAMWVNLPSTLSGVTTMISTLKGYVGTWKYVKFHSADYTSASPVIRLVKIADCKVTINRGGTIKYNIELVMIL